LPLYQFIGIIRPRKILSVGKMGFDWRSIGFGFVTLLVASHASAQSSAPLADWQDSPGIVLRSLGGPVSDWNFTVGMGIASLPAYEGSNSTRLTAAPEFDIRYKDIAFASISEGVGVNILRGTTYRAGVAMTYDMGREHNAATRLSGTGNVDPALAPKIFGEIAFLPVVFHADIRARVTGQSGVIGDLSAYMPVVANETIQVFVGPSVTFADDNYMNAYFGISPQHAQPQSMFKTYTATGGVKNVNLGVSALYHVDDHWLFSVTAGVEKLLGSAANSPITQTSYQLGGAAMLCYTWD
jgi:outer membrane scaffolding protein for murein synthesis (MipA/OmpV family)